MGEQNGDCVQHLEQDGGDIIYERVLVGENGEAVFVEGEEEYGEVYRGEEYIRLEDGTFIPAGQSSSTVHAVIPQTSGSASVLQQVRIPPVSQRIVVDPSSRFHVLPQSYAPRPAQIPRQTSFELDNKSTVLTYPSSASVSKPFSSSTSGAMYHIPSQTTSKPKKKPLPGQRKPCNCTKSMCLKLYCDCFANGEFCHDCNCKDCHNNLEHDADRSKAIKQSLERNPNAFKPKIGVKSGKVDAERLHQKGCHCKKSGCLKNYCECFEAKVPCTSRCKCHGCQNTEVDRATRSDRLTSSNSALMNLANAASSLTTGSPSSPLSENESEPESSTARTDPRSYPWFYMTDEVIEAATMCLVAQADESLSRCTGEASEAAVEEMERMVLGEFGRCLQEIISNASES
ncbi:hypothetical protein Q1695_005159 [Nippostrongylus brasiliensis]|nr:hypothetical protein Q1695_005159 [Nippostrongylus brasiliensis]